MRERAAACSRIFHSRGASVETAATKKKAPETGIPALKVGSA
jgi:hypothetical protein